jgi:hypothetical protein
LSSIALLKRKERKKKKEGARNVRGQEGGDSTKEELRAASGK